MKKILIIGYNTRYCVCSAKRAGYIVYSMDAFCSLDLERCADDLYQLQWVDNMPDKNLLKQINEFNVDFDAVVLGTGLEHIKLPYATLNNDYNNMRRVTNKAWFAKKLDRMGILHPNTFTQYNTDINFPVVIKPRYGAGGIGTFRSKGTSTYLACEEMSLPAEKVRKKFLIQEYIKGTPASVTVISTHEEAVSVAVNEQIIGNKAISEFSYSGNITPLDISSDIKNKMKTISEDLVLELGLIGSNGIDFVVSDNGEVFVIEANPRFQGSLDTVELSTDINLFDAHVKAFEDECIKETFIKRFAAKRVLFAEKKFKLEVDFQKIQKYRNQIADIPRVGTSFSKGDPILTLLKTAVSRTKVLQGLYKLYYKVKPYC